MNANEAIKFVKDKFGKDIAPEEAEKWLAERGGKELTDDELSDVTGAGMMIYGVAVCPKCGGKVNRLINFSIDVLMCESCSYRQ